MSRIKIQNVGIGRFIRNPKGIRISGVREVLKVSQNNGNSFLCYPVTDSKTVPATLDTARFYDIPIDTMVESASP